MTQSYAAWDIEASLRAVDGDRELLVEMAGLFLEDSARLVTEIGDAVRASDASALHRSAHTLKGSVANFCANRARDLALALEVMGRNGKLDDAAEVYAQLVHEMRGVDQDLASFARTGAA